VYKDYGIPLKNYVNNFLASAKDFGITLAMFSTRYLALQFKPRFQDDNPKCTIVKVGGLFVLVTSMKEFREFYFDYLQRNYFEINLEDDNL